AQFWLLLLTAAKRLNFLLLVLVELIVDTENFVLGIRYPALTLPTLHVVLAHRSNFRMMFVRCADISIDFLGSKTSSAFVHYCLWRLDKILIVITPVDWFAVERFAVLRFVSHRSLLPGNNREFEFRNPTTAHRKLLGQYYR
ncbi:MAG: hypothetical protein ABI643_00915, partial [Candidatus Doudnabacteria bacterium]